jgi:hypothetical protein
MKMCINPSDLISNLVSEIKPKTPSYAPLAFLRGFHLTNKFVTSFTKIAKTTQIVSCVNQSLDCVEFY